MGAVPVRGGVTGSYLDSPYQVTVAYGDSNAGIVRGDPSDWFGPLEPMRPIAPPEVAGRQWDFPSGYNLQTQRRPYEPITFGELRQFAQGYDLLRLVIETRKDQFTRQKWKIAPREDNKNPQEADIAAVTKLFRRPDGIRAWQDWSRVLLEDLFVIDAPAIYVQRNRGGKVISLFPLDGATIKPVIDDWGRRPMPFEGPGGKIIVPTAYQQVLKGYPAIDYTAADLVYRPRNVRATTPYGMSPTEQIFTTVNIGLRRQLFLLNYFTDGNMPDALIGVPDTWTPDQISVFQKYWDDMFSGNLENRRRAKFVAGAVAKSYVELKQPELTGVFDEWMAKIICFAFSIPPNTFSKNIANRASSDTSREVSEEEGLAPILEWVKSLIDDILEFQFELPGLEFVWQHEKAVDEAAQSAILIGYVGAGIQTRNEARNVLGLEKDQDPSADRLMITGTGAVPLDANTIEGRQANMAAFGTPDGTAPKPEPVAAQEDSSGQDPGDAKVAKRDVSDEARDDHGRWTTGGSNAASEGDKREQQKAKARERAAASRARAKHRAKEADRVKEREAGATVSTPRRAAAETPEQERADYHAIVRSIVRGSVLIAGGALVMALAPEAGAGIVVGKLAYVAGGIGETMLWTAAEGTAVHILVKLGFEPEHIDTILASLKEHILGKSAGAAGDLRAIDELKAKLPAVADMAVEEALDYVAENAPHATIAQHNEIAEAIEEKADEFKAKIEALTPGSLTSAAKIAKAGGRLAHVPFDRAATRKARAALWSTMTDVLEKVGKKAVGHVRESLKALGKAEESPEDIADRADFTDFEEAVPEVGDALAGVASESARQTLVHIGVSDSADLMNQVNEGAIEAAHDRAAEMVGMRRLADGTLAPSKNAKNTITETTRDMLRSIISDGLEANIGSDEIAQNIENATAFSPERAELIAYTEVGNANSTASLGSAHAAADEGVEVLKGWLTTGDSRVEELCRANEEAGFIPLDDDFPSGDAAPLAHPRCRCVIRYKVAAN